MSKKDFVKITFQDIEIAEEFFENQKHLDEFLCAVVDYYRGKTIRIKTKIVKKYFETYKKTMDFVLQAKEKGREGAKLRYENEIVTSDTLVGSLLAPPEGTLVANNKDIISNNKLEKDKKEKEEKESVSPPKISIPSWEEFLAYSQKESYERNLKIDKVKLKIKYDGWVMDDWHTGKGRPIKNWKSTIINTLCYLQMTPYQAQARQDNLPRKKPKTLDDL
jgi:hypothetical protein